MDLAVIAAFLVLTFADQVMTGTWAFVLGPNRARTMIIGDPLFQELRLGLKDILEALDKVDDLGGQVDRQKAEISGEISKIRGEFSALRGEVSSQLGQFKAGEVVLPEATLLKVEDRITKSAQASIRRALTNEELTQALRVVIREEIAAAKPAEDLEAILSDQELSTTEGKQAAYDWLRGKGVPEEYAFRIADAGPAVIRKVAKARGWNVLEIVDGGGADA